MPYVSGAQRGWAHTPAGEKALGGPSKVAEWDAASKGQHVPYKVGGSAVNKGYQGKSESFAAGGPVLGRQKSWAKDGNVARPANDREDGAEKTDFGKLIGGVDRFTSANLADSAEPANVRRTKPNEDWTKGSAPSSAVKNVRSGDTKSTKPIKPRS